MKRISLLIILLAVTFISDAQTDTTFWFAAPFISTDYSYNKPIVLKISSYQQPCSVTVSQPANGGLPTQTFSIPANSIQSVDLTAWLTNIECSPGNIIQNRGLKITSDNKIGVYYEVNGNGPNPEMFALKGKNALGNQFYISSQYLLNNTPTYNPLPYSSFNIVATEDNTIVSINPTSNITGHAANVPFQVTLNRGQTYAAIASSQVAAQHLQGSAVSSSKPIAITLCDDLLFGNIYGGVCSDLAGDQTVPIDVIGNEYIAFKSNLNYPYDKVYITATQNFTNVTQDGVLIKVLNIGQSVELTVSNSSTYIKTSAPAYAYQLSGIGCEVGSAILPKVNCSGSSSVSVARSTNEPFVITLLVKAGAQNNFMINNTSGVITGSQFNVVPGTAGIYYFARIDLPLSNYPNGSIISINNPSDVFQLGVLQGGVLSGGSFGYFSDFNSLQANANTINSNPCLGNTISLLAETISSGTYNWTGPNGFTSNLQNPVLNNIAVSNTGSYILKVTVPGCAIYNDTIALKVKPPSFSNISQTICEGLSFNGYNKTGTYIDTLIAANGCDSVRTINLTVKPRSLSTINQTICQGKAVAGYSTTGTYIDTLIAANGCDSIRTINLIVKPRSLSTINQTICQGNNFFGYNTSGTYIDTLISANGCDSIRTINLTVKPTKYSIINQSLCPGQSYNGYTVTGTYIDTLVAFNGCDSIRTINLLVNPILFSHIDQTICQGKTYAGYSSAGIYIDTLVSVMGCDSVRTINLSIKPASFTNINQILCQGENYAGYKTSGIYIDTLQGVNSCDSIRTLNLIVKPSSNTFINLTICRGENYFGYTASGIFNDTLIASNGCDSIRTLNLMVVDQPIPDLGLDKIICETDSLKISPGIFPSYLWQDGSNKSYFIVKNPGLYSVTVSNTCGTGTDEIILTGSVCEIYFPNAFSPNKDSKNDVFKILNGDRIANYYMAIFDRWGNKVFETNDTKKGWDGNYKGQPAEPGAYIWTSRFNESNSLRKMRGSVLLIR